MNFWGIGALEALAIGLIAFIVLGPDRFIETARQAGKTIRQLRKATQDISRMADLDIDDRPRETRKDAPDASQSTDEQKQK